MIRGALDIVSVPRLRVKLRNFAGSEMEIGALVDTGFTSTLSIPPYVATALKLSKSGTVGAKIADGSRPLFDIFEVQIEWDGVFLEVVASAMGREALIGMRLLRGHQLRIDVEPLGKIEIEPLPISQRP